MKKLLLPLLALMALVFPVLASAQTSTESIISLKKISAKGVTVSQVVTQPIKTFYPLNFQVDLRGFGGLHLTNQTLTGGATLSHPFGSFNLGGYVYLEQGHAIDGGFYFGLSLPLTKKPPSTSAVMTISGEAH